MWSRLARLYVIGAAAILALGVMLDASFLAHFQSQYPYSAKVDLLDVVKIIRGFSLADLNWILGAVALLSLETLLVALRPRLLAPRWRIIFGAPQLLLIPLGLIGAMSFTLNRDGEWLHEGHDLMEAFAFWAPVPLAVFVRAVNDLPRNLTA